MFHSQNPLAFAVEDRAYFVGGLILEIFAIPDLDVPVHPAGNNLIELFEVNQVRNSLRMARESIDL